MPGRTIICSQENSLQPPDRSEGGLQPEQLESLRNLQVAQSKLMMEQQEMEIAVMLANQSASPNEAPPQYISPPSLKDTGTLIR